MSKINVSMVVCKHYKTLSNQRGVILRADIFTHIALPILISLVVCYFYGELKQSLASVFVNFGAITTALLMSAVIMIFDQKQKIQSKIRDIQKKITDGNSDSDADSDVIILSTNKVVYEQLCHNISYAILSSVILVVCSVIVSFFPEAGNTSNLLIFKIIFYIVSFFSYTSFISTVITFLMVIKRFSSILDH